MKYRQYFSNVYLTNILNQRLKQDFSITFIGTYLHIFWGIRYKKNGRKIRVVF